MDNTEKSNSLKDGEERAYDGKKIDTNDSPETLSSRSNLKKIDKISETYDVITPKELTDLDDWQGINKSSLKQIPPIDPNAVKDLEKHAQKVGQNLDFMLSTLSRNLKSMSSITCHCQQTYSESVDNVGDTVDNSIKAMYALIAKCEELCAQMRPVYQLTEEIKEIKKALDIFEAQCK